MDKQKAFIYHYQNTGVVSASQDITGDSAQYNYQNVGVVLSSQGDSGDSAQYQYQNVDGSVDINAQLPPTFN